MIAFNQLTHCSSSGYGITVRDLHASILSIVTVTRERPDPSVAPLMCHQKSPEIWKKTRFSVCDDPDGGVSLSNGVFAIYSTGRLLSFSKNELRLLWSRLLAACGNLPNPRVLRVATGRRVRLFIVSSKEKRPSCPEAMVSDHSRSQSATAVHDHDVMYHREQTNRRHKSTSGDFKA